MNVLISHGQAMRSVFGRSRVTHFMAAPFVADDDTWVRTHDYGLGTMTDAAAEGSHGHSHGLVDRSIVRFARGRQDRRAEPRNPRDRVLPAELPRGADRRARGRARDLRVRVCGAVRDDSALRPPG